MTKNSHIKPGKAWTDYPFVELGDTPHQPAPIREIEVISYDGDKSVDIIVGGLETQIKAGYIYQTRRRYR